MEPWERKIATPELARRALGEARAWETGQRENLTCPICGANGLVIIDKSARPHQAWYELNCAACGLSEAIAVPETAHASEND